MQRSISVAERLCVTIHFLAYGNSQQPLSYGYRIGKSTISGISNATCLGFKEQYLQLPNCPGDWKRIARDFKQIWNRLHCVGATYGKHMAITLPTNSGSLYHNYKGYFSTVLMAIRDARYVFTLVDIGNYGSNNDSRIF